MKRSTITLFLLLLFQGALLSQDPDEVLAPQQYPASPTTAELGKYGDVPVSKYTGIPNIAIPIYTIQSSQLSLPISMSYHASGVKVDAMASWVGMNWSLNAGGAITRMVRGYPDEGPQGFLTVPTVPNDIDNLTYDYMRAVAAGEKDAEPDLFSFNINGVSGQFVLDQSGEVHMIPHQDITVDLPAAFGGTGGSNWVITTIEGNKYTFGGINIETSVSGDNTCASIESGQAYTSAWYISGITSADGQDQIDFAYHASENEKYNASGSEVQYDPNVGGPVSCVTKFEELCTGSNSFATIKLKTITFANGKLEFVKSGGRLDHLDNTGSKLDEIQIFAGTTLLKKHVFTYAQVQSSSLTNPIFANHISQRYRMYLDKIEEKDAANIGSGKDYAFFYDNRGLLPPRLSLNQDHWGFYNGPKGNQHLVPAKLPGSTTDFYIGGGDRTSDFNYGKYGTLNKIIYPTGGETVFEYEAHDLANGNFVPGGIRIAKITNDADSPDPNVIRIFDYADSTTNVSTGIHMNYFYYSKVLTVLDNGNFGGADHCIYTQYVSNNYLPVSQGAAVVYTQVTESLGENAENGKIHEVFTFTPDVSNTGGSPFAPRTSQEFRRGLLVKQRSFKKVGSNFIPVAETRNIYKFSEDHGDLHGTAVKALKVHQKAQLFCSQGCAPVSNYLNDLFDLKNYYIDSEWFYLDSSITRKYNSDASDYIETTTAYTYHNTGADHIQPLVMEQTDSDGQVTLSRTIYTGDFTANSTIIKPVEVLREKNGKTISGSFVEYDSTGKPLKSHRLITDGSLKTQATSTTPPSYFQLLNEVKYNNAGKVIEHVRLGGRPVAYLYGYNDQYVIAIFENADKDQVNAAITAAGTTRAAIQTQTGATLENTLNTIRAHAGLSEARITSYTYSPLIGMISQKDPNGITQTFEYDSFLRLRLIRDHDGNILSKNEYNLKGVSQQ